MKYYDWLEDNQGWLIEFARKTGIPSTSFGYFARTEYFKKHPVKNKNTFEPTHDNMIEAQPTSVTKEYSLERIANADQVIVSKIDDKHYYYLYKHDYKTAIGTIRYDELRNTYFLL